jgi:hypothetical protein
MRFAVPRAHVTEVSATVTMGYNSTNKVLQFYANGKMLLDLEIAADGQHRTLSVRSILVGDLT